MMTSPSTRITRQGNTPPPFYVRVNRISCNQCRKRKLKCDRVKPCTTCTKRGIASQCYQEDGDEQTEAAATATAANASSPMKRSRLETSSSKNGGYHSEASEGSNLASSISKWKGQMDAIAKIAKQSTTSLDTALLALSKDGSERQIKYSPFISAASRPDGLVTWEDVCEHLPAVEECEDLITFYFEELCSYIRISQRSGFEKQWRRLLDGTGIPRIEAAIIFTAFALADIMIPSASLIRRHSREDHHRWIMLLGDPKSSPIKDSVDNSFSKIQLLGLTSIYHLYEGRADHMWECVGVAMRKAILFGIFDERTKSWAGLTSLEKEYRRRLAWYMLTLDRWQSLLRQLPFALHPSHVYLAEPSFEPDSRIARSNIPAKIVPNTPGVLPDGRLTNRISAKRPGNVKFVLPEIMSWCHEFVCQYASMDPPTRYNRALLLDDALERVLLEGLYNTGIEHHELRFLSTSILDECVKERQVEVNLWISSIFFLRCIITRRFLTDDGAPPNLRFVSLIYAQGILATIPSLTRLIKEGHSPIQSTWNANHLLAAATTFTVVILGQDHYIESLSNPIEVEAHHSESKALFPTAQMDWLFNNIFITVECLDTLTHWGNHSAAVAKQLLERLCVSQDNLRKLYRQHFDKIAIERESSSHPPNVPRRENSNKSESFSSSPSSTRGQRQYNNLPSSYQNDFHSTILQASPFVPSITPPATTSAQYTYGQSTFADTPTHLPPMSASSLLDAVLMDPTELDFLSNNHSDLLANLLKDSPP